MFRRMYSMIKENMKNWQFSRLHQVYGHDSIKIAAAGVISHISLSTILEHNTMVNQKRNTL